MRETKAPEGYALGTAFGPVFDLAYDAGGAEVMTWKSVCGDSKTPLTPAPTPAPNQTAPKTGDGSSPLIWLLACAAAMSVTFVAVSRLRGKKNPPEKEDCE